MQTAKREIVQAGFQCEVEGVGLWMGEVCGEWRSPGVYQELLAGKGCRHLVKRERRSAEEGEESWNQRWGT